MSDNTDAGRVSIPLQRELEALQEDNKDLRHLLFIAHGSQEHYLYGDDGERSCNTCMIDFNRDTPQQISDKIMNYNLRKLAMQQRSI